MRKEAFKIVKDDVKNVLLNLMPLEGDTERTPDRMAGWLIEKTSTEIDSGINRDKSIAELIKSNGLDVLFKSDRQEGNLVEIKDIPFYSLCEHHMLPFFGFVNITYKVEDYVLGLSKFPRIVELLSNTPQLQERLANDIYVGICSALGNTNVKVKVHSSRHMCVEMRGAKTCISTDVTVGTII